MNSTPFLTPSPPSEVHSAVAGLAAIVLTGPGFPCSRHAPRPLVGEAPQLTHGLHSIRWVLPQRLPVRSRSCLDPGRPRGQVCAGSPYCPCVSE